METFNVSSSSRNELIDISGKVKDIVQKQDISDGYCVVFTPHTTAAITINENADPRCHRQRFPLPAYGRQQRFPHQIQFGGMFGTHYYRKRKTSSRDLAGNYVL